MKSSANCVRNASCSRFAVRSVAFGSLSADNKKSCRIQSESCSSILRIQFRLIFDYHTLNRATLGRSRVINTNLLAGSQWSCHSLASSVNDVRSRAESKTYRALLAPDDNRLAGLICTYRARFISCARSCFCRGRRSGRRCSFFGRGRAGLCKRQGRNQSADQSNDCSLHSHASFLIRFTPTVRDSRLGRTLLVVNLFVPLLLRKFKVLAISTI